MIANSTHSRPQPYSSFKGLLLAGSAVLSLVTAPATVDIYATHPGLAWHNAQAMGGGGGNGGGHGGGGSGGGHGGGAGNGPGGGGGQEHGRGYGPGGGNGPGNATYDSMAEFMGELRNALGVGRQDRAMAEARARYRDALDGPARQGGKVPGGFDGGRGPDPDRAAYRFDAEETKALIARGWRDPMEHDGFESQAARTRTMMELAKRLGYGERVGAMQAAFGTPYENGIADLEIRFAGARAAGNQTEVERLEGELAAAIASPKAGAGPDSSWATADLDVNHDRRVDVQDLEALDQREPPQARSSPPAN